MLDVTIAAPKLTDIEPMVKKARPEDRREWFLASGRSMAYTLDEAMRKRVGITRVLSIGGEPMVTWGGSPSAKDPSMAGAWLVATTAAPKYAFRIQRHFEEGIAELHAKWRNLQCWAWGGNGLHLYWLRRMGFEETGRTAQSAIDPTEQFVEFMREAAAPQCA